MSRGDVEVNIYGVRISSAGVILDSPALRISAALGDQLLPCVAYDGTNFVAVWQDPRVDANVQHVYGARISTAGVVLDPLGIAISGANAAYQPAVACGTSDCFASWVDGSAGNGAVVGVHVAGATVVDPTAIAVSGPGSRATRPAIAWDGSQYLLAWVQGSAHGVGVDADLVGATVQPDGGASAGSLKSGVDASLVAVEEYGALVPQRATAIGTNKKGESLVAYARLDLAPTFGTFRVRARFVGPGEWVDGGALADGGARDGGDADAASGPDGSTPTTDGGGSGGAGTPSAGSCGCIVGGGSAVSASPWPIALLIGLAMWLRRRSAGAVACSSAFTPFIFDDGRTTERSLD